MTQPGREKPAEKIYRVFVSSTYMDNRERRDLVLNAIDRHRAFKAIAMEWWSADERPPEVVDEDRLADADLLLLILAHRYGAISPATGKSYTELEFDRALAKKVPILAFQVDPSAPINRETDFDPGPDRWDKQKLLDAFRDRVLDGKRVARPFVDDEFEVLVYQALSDWKERKENSRRKRATARRQHPAEIAEYLRHAESQNETIALAGFETKVRVPIKLDDLYVPLRAVPDALSRAGKAGSIEEAMEDASFREGADELPLSEAFRCAAELGGRRGVVVLGDPGSGKATQMKRMLLSVIRNGAGALGLDDEDVVPVLLPLRNLEDATRGFADFVEREHGGPEADMRKGFGRRLLKRGKLLFLLDGLDEVKAERRAEVARWIRAAASRRRDCYFVVTCRYAGYVDDARLDQQFLELHLKPLETKQTEDFIRRWFRIVETSLVREKGKRAAERKAATEAEELIRHLREPDIRATRVFAMTRNPLLLTAICLVHRDRGRLPKRRVDLYDECVNVLLERWRVAKDMDVSLEATSARQVLQPVAWLLHQKRNRTRATAKELAPALKPALAAARWDGGTPEQFLETIRDESGLLTGWSGDAYGFMHLGFQEYLAARELRRLCLDSDAERERLTKFLAGKFGQSWWREVTLLLLAMEDAPFEALFEHITRRVAFSRQQDLVNACVEDALRFSAAPFLSLLSRDPGRDSKLWARQLAAARLLRRVAPEAVKPLAKRLAKHPHPELALLFGGKSVATSVSTKAAIELVTIPGGVFLMGADAKLEINDVTDKSLARWVEHMQEAAVPLHRVSVQSFQLGKYPVTNAQYGEFMKATGHREPEEWGNSAFNQPEQPVVGVSWDDAAKFCKWAGLRLPSEAEWEYACRGQQDGLSAARTRYWSGNDEEDLARVAWYRRNSGGSTKPVGGKPANPFGLHDMHGNVFEWCSDRWHGSYEGAPEDGSSWDEGPSEARVIRGGSFRISAVHARSAFRTGALASLRWDDRGFRVASPSPPSDPHPLTT